MQNCTVERQSYDFMAGEGAGMDSVIGTLGGDAVTNGSIIDARKVNGEGMDVMSDGCADGALAVEGTTESTEHSALDVLAEGCDYLVELHRFLLQTTEMYRAGDDTKGRELFMELIQGLEWFVKIASVIESQLNIDFSATNCAGRSINESVENLNGILLEIIVAQEQQDLVLLTDLLEYELAPQLELWLEIFTTLRYNRDKDNFQ